MSTRILTSALALFAPLLATPAMAAPADAGRPVEPPVRPDLTSGQTADPAPELGPGWYLTVIDRGKPTPEGLRTKSQRLVLVAPDGRRTTVLGSSAARKSSYRLVDWSADGSTALLTTEGRRHSTATRVDVATGETASVRLPQRVSEVVLAPDGDGLLTVDYQKGSPGRAPLSRLSWDGDSTRINPDVDGPVLPTPDGTAVITHGAWWGGKVLRVISLADGSVAKRIDTPRPCTPVRWWDDHALLASCNARQAPTLSLVDVDDGTVTPLTERIHPQQQDLGHLDARALGHRVFVQVAGPCGYTYVGRQHRDGQITKVRVPHAVGNVLLVDARGSRLTLQHAISCDGSAPRSALTRFDPQTGKERRLVVLPRRAAFDAVLPYGELRATGY
jgi:TolB protein